MDPFLLPLSERLSWIKSERQRAAERAKLAAALPHGTRRAVRVSKVVAARVFDHSLTEYPCRLPDGTLGRTAIRHINGEWVAACVNRPRARRSALARSIRTAVMRPR